MNAKDVVTTTKSTGDEVSLCPPPDPASLSLNTALCTNSNIDDGSCCIMMPTDMLYMTYDGNFMTECRSTIVDVVTVVPPSLTPKAIATTVHPIDDPCHLTSQSIHHQKQQQQVCIVLDRTVMHAQGGGQPTDIGQLQVLRSLRTRTKNNHANECLESDNHHEPKQDDNENETNEKSSTTHDSTPTESILIDITKVELDRITGIVKHYGSILPFDSNSSENEPDESQLVRLRIGDIVQVQVNSQQRQLLSECHTAGHVVDAVMFQCGYRLKPSKGYHFLDSPYVEYFYNSDSHSKNMFINEKQDLSKLQQVFQQLLQQDIPTKIELLSKEEAHIRCNGSNNEETFFDMDMYCTTPNDPIVRIVTVAGYACPCGGTHVRSTGDLLRSSSYAASPSNYQHHTWNITGIKCKPKGFVRIKYGRVILNQT